MSDDLKNARKVLTAYDELVDDLRAENERLRTALIRLMSAPANKMDEAIEGAHSALVARRPKPRQAGPPT